MNSRMYFFVPYNLSDIQKGIQAGHAFGEYMLKYGNDVDFRQYLETGKTWIVLDGGTTCDAVEDKYKGSMQYIIESLTKACIKHAVFQEPDINFATTAVCFLCDPTVYDYKFPVRKLPYKDRIKRNLISNAKLA